MISLKIDFDNKISKNEDQSCRLFYLNVVKKHFDNKKTQQRFALVKNLFCCLFFLKVYENCSYKM